MGAGGSEPLQKPYLLREADINVQELCEVAEQHAVDGGRGRAPQHVVVSPKQHRDRLQVLSGKVPDHFILMPSHPLQTLFCVSPIS